MTAKKHDAKSAHKKAAHSAESKPAPVTPVLSAASSHAPVSSPPPTLPSPPPIPPSRFGFTFQQKVALIGGALLLALVLGTILWPSLAIGDANANYLKFKTAMEDSNQSGIIMDLRGATPAARQKILQCGVDLIFGGFFSKANKDLLVYSCDDTGCMSSHYLRNSSETVNTTIPFSDALYGLRGRPYFHLLYGAESKPPVYTPVYSEVFITSDSNESCGISVQ